MHLSKSIWANPSSRLWIASTGQACSQGTGTYVMALYGQDDLHCPQFLHVSDIEVVFRRIKLNTSVTTINPMEPANVKQEITILIVLLSTKFSSPLLHKA